MTHDEQPAPSTEPADTPDSAVNWRALPADKLPPDALKAALGGDALAEGDALRPYVEQLFEHALSARDTEAALLVARYMDTHPALDEALSHRLKTALVERPDAAYWLIRTRLAEGVDLRWLDHLQNAARSALQVAIREGDTETLLNWFRLVAREPAAYDLNDVLNEALLAAHSRARTDSELARQIVLLAVRRAHGALESLLSDAEFLAALPDNLGSLLRDFEGDPLGLHDKRGIEIFLLTMSRAANAGAGTLFTPQVVERIWSNYTADQPIAIPERYNADSIILTWVAKGRSLLNTLALETFLRLALIDRRDELFLAMVRRLKGDPAAVPLMLTALQASARPDKDILDLVGRASSAEDLSLQASAELYTSLLMSRSWPESSLTLAEQLARVLEQHAAVTIMPDALWRMLALASTVRSEPMARLTVRRLAAELENQPDENLFVDNLLRLYTDTAWAVSARTALYTWWRTFVRAQPVARLHRIDKLLENKRPLEEARTTLQTVLLIHRLLDNQTLDQFAASISTVLATLQALAEAFEPSPRRPIGFDQITVRAELEARTNELSQHQRKVLANDLKGLAQLVSDLGDSRSKASLMRQNVDRQLMTGEHQPASAVDTLKWLSGYFSGTQDRPAENDIS